MRRDLRLAFAGTPDFAVPVLAGLVDNQYPVVAVYTQPDRPAGRGRKPQPSPVKHFAEQAGIELRQPPTLRSPEVQQQLRALALDLLVVVAYGLILPPTVLAAPTRGCINVHASLLPRWRGAAPIQRAIMAGDNETGASIMQMDAGLDTGPVHATAACTIAAGTTAGELHDLLASLGAKTLLAVLPALLSGDSIARPQDESGACYAAKLEKSEAALDWCQPAAELARRVLAFNPWPGAYTTMDDGRQRLRIMRARAELAQATAAPGSVTGESESGIRVATGDGELWLTELQLPGKKPLDAKRFLNGRSLAGQRLGGSS